MRRMSIRSRPAGGNVWSRDMGNTCADSKQGTGPTSLQRVSFNLHDITTIKEYWSFAENGIRTLYVA